MLLTNPLIVTKIGYKKVEASSRLLGANPNLQNKEYLNLYKKRCIMLDLGTYIRLILMKKNMSQQDIVNKVNSLGIMEHGAIFTRQKLSNILNGITPLSKSNAYRIEKALELKEGSLERFITRRR